MTERRNRSRCLADTGRLYYDYPARNCRKPTGGFGKRGIDRVRPRPVTAALTPRLPLLARLQALAARIETVRAPLHCTVHHAHVPHRHAPSSVHMYRSRTQQCTPGYTVTAVATCLCAHYSRRCARVAHMLRREHAVG